jgi:hypothetical protein
VAAAAAAGRVQVVVAEGLQIRPPCGGGNPPRPPPPPPPPGPLPYNTGDALNAMWDNVLTDEGRQALETTALQRGNAVHCPY